MLIRTSTTAIALVITVLIISGCSDSGEQSLAPIDDGSDALAPATSRTAPGATLSIWSTHSEPNLLLDDPAEIRTVLDALPSSVRSQLLEGGVYETHEATTAEACWSTIRSQLIEKTDRPDRHLENVSWGRIKLEFGG